MRYPHLGSLHDNPYVLWETSLVGLHIYRHHAFELARDFALELDRLRVEIPSLYGRGRPPHTEEHPAFHNWPRAEGKLFRRPWMTTGKSTRTRLHGPCPQRPLGKQFSRKPTGARLRQRWISEDVAGSTLDFANDHTWQPKVKDFEHAICCSNNSSPGPDGIPYSAWMGSWSLCCHSTHLRIHENDFRPWRR